MKSLYENILKSTDSGRDHLERSVSDFMKVCPELWIKNRSSEQISRYEQTLGWIFDLDRLKKDFPEFRKIARKSLADAFVWFISQVKVGVYDDNATKRQVQQAIDKALTEYLKNKKQAYVRTAENGHFLGNFYVEMFSAPREFANFSKIDTDLATLKWKE